MKKKITVFKAVPDSSLASLKKVNRFGVTAFFLMVLGLTSFLTMSFAAEANTGEDKSSKRKDSIGLDQELEEDEKKRRNDENIYKESIDVEGNNEQLLKSQKKESKLNQPPHNEAVDWREPDEEIMKLTANRARQTEKTADIRVDYGNFNSLDLGIHVSKKEKFGIYLINYERQKGDKKGTLQSPIANSEYSFDNLGLIAEFTLSQWYLLNFSFDYFSSLESLQANSRYGNQSKRYGALTLENYFTGENQRTGLAIKGLIGESALAPLPNLTVSEKDSTVREINADLQWQYMFNLSNSLVASARFRYDDQRELFANDDRYNRVMQLQLWDTFPLLRNDNEDGSTTQINVTLGVNLFAGYQMPTIVGPLLLIHMIFDKYISKISLSREGQLPGYETEFFHKSYYTLESYSQVSDKWRADWYHRFNLNKKFNFGFSFGYLDNRNFYEYKHNADTLYALNFLYARLAETSIFLKWVLSDYLFLESLTKYTYALQDINLLSPLSQSVKLSHQSESLALSLEWNMNSARKEAAGILLTREETLSAIHLLNFHAEYFFNRTISLKFGLENLLNKSYKELFFYQNNGLRISAGVHFIL